MKANETHLEKLLKRLSPKGSGILSVGKTCAMDTQNCTKCSGCGVILSQGGMNIKAEVCRCIQECTLCRGSAKKREEDKEFCVSPSPLKLAQRLTQAKLPARYIDVKWGSFQNDSGNGREIAARLQAWLKSLKSGLTRQGILLQGPVGVGKTYLLVGLAKELCRLGFSVRFTDFFQLLTELKMAYADGKGDPEVLGPLRDVDVLVIDELGKGRNSEWEISICDTLISERYNAGKTILISTNYLLRSDGTEAKQGREIDIWNPLPTATTQDFSPMNFGQLENRVGKRVFSRLMEMTIPLELTGRDMRFERSSGKADWR